jgi:hypothetical protein
MAPAAVARFAALARREMGKKAKQSKWQTGSHQIRNGFAFVGLERR